MPVSLEEQVIPIYALTNGYGNDVPVDKIQQYEIDLLQFMRSSHPEVGQAIASQKQVSDDIEASLRSSLAEFNQSAGYAIPEDN